MPPSLRELLADALDYAGLLPPARLELGPAIRHYAAGRASAEAWLLSRFVCPAARLEELGALRLGEFTPAVPCRVTVLGGEDPLTPEFVRDVRLISHFCHAHGPAYAVEALDVALSPEVLRDWRREEISEALNVLATRLIEHHRAGVEVYVEPPGDGDWEATVAKLVGALELHDQTHGQPAPTRIGFKLRAGGAEPASAPTIEQVALVLAACRDASIPLKFAGGLHHPLRHTDARSNAASHGFVNLFVAGVLAYARGVDQATLGAVLAEQSPEAFRFNAEELRWRERGASIDEIADARGEFVISFGSCSFDEPREGLRKLGWL